MSEASRKVVKLVVGNDTIFGPRDSFPKLSEFQSLISSRHSMITTDLLPSLAYQVILQAPEKVLPQCLNILVCAYLGADPSALQQLADSSGGSKICGKIFKRGEIVWTCKQCGLDPTCVQCDDCFRSSDHTGHEVFFHKSGAGGGCCDCGDEEAWKDCGNCPNHGKKVASKEGEELIDPALELPIELAEAAKATITGVILTILDFVIKSVRGFGPLDENIFMNEYVEENKLCLRLFNDDFHTYDEVSSALKACGFNVAARTSLTRIVDKVGSAKIISGSPDEIREKFRILRPQLHLLVSVVPENVVMQEANILKALVWLQDVAAYHNGLRRIKTNVLITELSLFSPQAISSIKAFDGCADVRGSSFLDLHDGAGRFPLEIPIIDCRTAPSLRGAVNPLPFETPVISGLGTNVFSVHAEILCPLAVLMASSHFLTKPMQEALNEVLVSGLRDEVFRPAFTQILTMLYPVLHKQFCIGLGTAELSILRNTCQVYTANSLVMQNSSAGLLQRVFPSPEHLPAVNISTVIVQCAIQSMWLSCVSNSLPAGWVTEFDMSSPLQHHRYRQSLRDLGYLMKCPSFVLDALRGSLDDGFVDGWLQLCSELSGIDSYKCIRTGAHVEREKSDWHYALELTIELENTSTEFLDDAFLKPIEQGIDMALVVNKRKDILKYLTQKAISLIQETWESSSARMAHLGDGKSLVNVNPDAAVTASHVSIHNTREKFLAKCIVTAARGGVDFSLQDFDGIYGFMLGASALRSFAFIAQAKSQIWVRNGIAPLNIAQNYEHPPISLMFQDIELHVLQLALYDFADKKSFLNIARFIFETAGSPMGDLNAIPLGSDTVFRGGKVVIALVSELLRVLILLMTHVPVDLVSHNCSGLRTVLKKEIIHLMLSGSKSKGQLQKAKALVGGPDDIISESLFNSIVSELTKSPSGSDGEPAKLSLKTEYVLHYDPEHVHATSNTIQATFDAVRETRKSMKRDGRSLPPTPWPVVSTAAILPPHGAFTATRSLLYSPALADFLSYLVVSVFPSGDERTLKAGGQAVVSKVIYLLTLQLHCYDDVVGYVRSIHNLTEYAKYSAHHSDVLNFETSSLTQPEGSMLKLLSLLTDVFKLGYISSDEYYQEGLDFVLSAYAKRRTAIKRIVEEKCVSLTGLTDGLSSSSTGTDSLKRRRDEAMSKAMYTMRKRAAQFFEANEMALPKALSSALTISDDDGSKPAVSASDDDIDNAMEEETGILDGIVHCIVCRDVATDSRPCGYLSLVQASTALSNIILSESSVHSGDIPLSSIYRVVAQRGAAVLAGPSDKAMQMTTLEHGTHIQVSQRLNGTKWVEICSPCSGWCAVYIDVEHQDAVATGEEANADLRHTGQEGASPPLRTAQAAPSMTPTSTGLASAIGAAWRRQLNGLLADPLAITGTDIAEAAPTSKTVTVPVLQPVSELMFNKFGSRKPHVSSCGHAMHFDCYCNFFSASISKQLSDAFYEQIMSVDTEFRCPMCNAIGNSLMPDVPCKEVFCSPAAGSIKPKPADLLVPSFLSEEPDHLNSTTDRADNLWISSFADQILARSQDTSPFMKRPPSASRDEILMRLEHLEQLQAGWTAAAHTLLLATCNQRWAMSREAAALHAPSLAEWKIPHQDMHIIECLLKHNMNFHLILRRIPYEYFVLQGLRNLLCCVPKWSKEAQDKLSGTDLIDTVPLVKIDSGEEQNASEVLKHLPNSIIPSDTFSYSSNEMSRRSLQSVLVSESADLWSFLKQPLLTHDLFVMAVAAVSNSARDQACYLELINILCGGKLMQVFIEPYTSQSYLSQQIQTLDKSLCLGLAISESTQTFYSTMKSIRQDCGISVISDEPTVELEYVLISTVIDSLLPYLHFCFNLLLACGVLVDIPQSGVDCKQGAAPSIGDAVLSNNPEYAILTDILLALKLPTFDELLGKYFSNAVEFPYAKIWPSDFMAYHCDLKLPIANPVDALVPATNSKPIAMSLSALKRAASSDNADAKLPVPTSISMQISVAQDQSMQEDVDEEADSESASEKESDENSESISDRDSYEEEEGVMSAAMTRELVDEMFVDEDDYDEDSEEYFSDDSAAARHNLAISNGSEKKSGWPYIGVDPRYDHVDSSDYSYMKKTDSFPLYSPFLGSISGTHAVFDTSGTRLRNGFFDLSSFSIGIRHHGSFVKLPSLYTELYQQYKLPDALNGEEQRRTTALCLVCGVCVQAGNRDSSVQIRGRGLSPGECSLHAYRCGAGKSVFMLIEDCKCLLVSGPLQMYAPPVYVDTNGETCDVRQSTKPLFLSRKRVEKLEELYFKQKIANEVCHKRSTETHVIRNNYF